MEQSLVIKSCDLAKAKAGSTKMLTLFCLSKHMVLLSVCVCVFVCVCKDNMDLRHVPILVKQNNDVITRRKQSNPLIYA